MRLLLALYLMLASCSLFVQAAAHAMAEAQPQAAGRNCEDMARHSPDNRAQDQHAPSDEQGCCPQMSLACLAAMHCLSPLAMPVAETPPLAAPRFAPVYGALAPRLLEGEPAPPESPPPQSARLTA